MLGVAVGKGPPLTIEVCGVSGSRAMVFGLPKRTIWGSDMMPEGQMFPKPSSDGSERFGVTSCGEQGKRSDCGRRRACRVCDALETMGVIGYRSDVGRHRAYADVAGGLRSPSPGGIELSSSVRRSQLFGYQRRSPLCNTPPWVRGRARTF